MLVGNGAGGAVGGVVGLGASGFGAGVTTGARVAGGGVTAGFGGTGCVGAVVGVTAGFVAGALVAVAGVAADSDRGVWAVPGVGPLASAVGVTVAGRSPPHGKAPGTVIAPTTIPMTTSPLSAQSSTGERFGPAPAARASSESGSMPDRKSTRLNSSHSQISY